MYAISYPLLAVVQIVDSLLYVYTLVLLAAVVLSWVNPDPTNPIVRILRQLTEPVFRRVRPYMPRTGMIDLTPLAVVFAIMFVQRGILPVIARALTDLGQ